MKTRIFRRETVRNFQPFTLQVEVESIGEARLLYHVFNRANLLDVLKGQSQLGEYFVGFNMDIDPNLNEDTTYSKLRNEIQGQGFEL